MLNICSLLGLLGGHAWMYSALIYMKGLVNFRWKSSQKNRRLARQKNADLYSNI